MTYTVTLIPGDGVGPELSEATRRVLEATGVGFEWDVQEAGADVMDKYGTPLPDHVLESICRDNMEDLYAGIEFEQGQPETLKLIDFIGDLSGKRIREDSGISIKPISV